MPSKLLLALMSAAFAVSATNVYAEDQTKTEAPQAQQIVAEGDSPFPTEQMQPSLIAEGEKEGEKADLIAEGEKKEGEKADLIAEGEKQEGEKADLIA